MPANGQDTGVRDTIGTYCPIWGHYETGETLRVPIYVFTDQDLWEVSFVFDCDCTQLKFVGAALAPDIAIYGGNTIFYAGRIAVPEWGETINSIYLTRLPEPHLPPPPLFSPSQNRQLFATAKFLILDPSCCYLDFDTASNGSFSHTYFYSGVSYSPCISWCSNLEGSVNCPVGVEDFSDKYESTSTTCAVHPNPFNSGTTLELDLPSSGHLSIVICDILGRHVRTIVDDFIQRGPHQFPWDGNNESGGPASSGVYFARITNGSDSFVRKLVLLR